MTPMTPRGVELVRFGVELVRFGAALFALVSWIAAFWAASAIWGAIWSQVADILGHLHP
jgi:hypothetical protein